MVNEKQNITFGMFLWLLLKKIFRIVLSLGWLFVRMTIYWIARLLYRIFRLEEIDIARTRGKKEQCGLTDFKGHTFTFKRSNEFVYNYDYYLKLLRTLDIDKEDKEDLVNYALRLVREAERGAFDTIYQYVIKNKEKASFDDFIISMIFSGNNKEVDVFEKTENPYEAKEATDQRYCDRVSGRNKNA